MPTRCAIISIGVTAALISNIAAKDDVQTKLGMAVLEKIIAARREIQSGQFIFSISGELEDRSKGPNGRAEYRDERIIYLDGKKLRSDSRAASGIGLAVTNCFGCYGDGSFVTYSTQPAPFVGKMAVTIKPASEAQGNQKVVDPRAVGLFPVFIDGLASFNVESFYAPQEDQVIFVDDDERDGNPLVHVHWTPVGHRAELHVWAYKDTYEVKKVESQWTNKGVHVVEQVESDRGSPISDVRYPKGVTYNMFLDDKPTRNESVRIEVVSINQPLDPKIFSLKGIESLPAGTPIQWTFGKPPCPEDASIVWNGDQIVCESNSYEFLSRKDSGARTFRFGLIALNVAVIMIIVAVLCYYKFRQA